MPYLYIIGGPNGAGKTTAAFSLLPDTFETIEISKDLSDKIQIALDKAIQKVIAETKATIPTSFILIKKEIL